MVTLANAHGRTVLEKAQNVIQHAYDHNDLPSYRVGTHDYVLISGAILGTAPTIIRYQISGDGSVFAVQVIKE